MIRWVPAGRLPRWPIWAIVAVSAWLALQALTLHLAAAAGQRVVTCPLKRLTGLPCPTCGATRGLMQLADGRPFHMLACNPLLFTFLTLALAILLIRLLAARSPQLDLTASQRHIAWSVGLALFLANWGYVIAFVG